MTTNITTLFAPGDALFTFIIVVTLIATKSLSGFLGARLAGFPSRTSWGMGFMTSAQMSTTLATASLGLKYGIFTEDILTALVILSIVSIMTSPFLAKLTLGHEVEKPSKFTRLWRGNGASNSHSGETY